MRGIPENTKFIVFLSTNPSLGPRRPRGICTAFHEAGSRHAVHVEVVSLRSVHKKACAKLLELAPSQDEGSRNLDQVDKIKLDLGSS